MIKDHTREIMIITQEEAAEVIQEISKIFRFGLDESHHDGSTHRQKLTQEIGDLLTMIDLLIDHGIIDPANLLLAKQAKITKLHQFSEIFDEKIQKSKKESEKDWNFSE